VPILSERGAEPLAAAGIASLIGVFSIIGRLGTGFLLDRLPGHWVGAVVFLLPIIACALLVYDGSNPFSQSFAAAIFGLTVGAEVDVIGYLTSRYFGLKRFGVFMGAMVGALAMGLAVGPLLASIAYDRFGGYSEFLLATMGRGRSLHAGPAAIRPARPRPTSAAYAAVLNDHRSSLR
jgi:predicted MFS family arabinose efflux permease